MDNNKNYMKHLFPDNPSPPAFIKGLDLSEGFYKDLIGPLLKKHFPQLSYSAALIGPGSDVLGFDTEISVDHDWGPRVQIFLHENDFEIHTPQIRKIARETLPETYKEYPIRVYARTVSNPGIRHSLKPGDPEMEPFIEIYTIKKFFMKNVGIDIEKAMTLFDWLSTTQHRFRIIFSGCIYKDGIGLEDTRNNYRWYPHDIWLYILASCWEKIWENEILTGRAGDVGDELGSKIIASRLVHDIMRLVFLMEKVYPPYSKWFGSAFKQLKSAPKLEPLLKAVLNGVDWIKRDKLFSRIYEILVAMHNELSITPLIHNKPAVFFDRPYTIIGGGDIAETIKNEIKDPHVKKLSEKWLIGSIDIFNDTHLLDDDVSKRFLLSPLYDCDN